jgi:hypothetical protein
MRTRRGCDNDQRGSKTAKFHDSPPFRPMFALSTALKDHRFQGVSSIWPCE